MGAAGLGSAVACALLPHITTPPAPLPTSAPSGQVPLLVVTSFPDAIPEALSATLKNVREHKYQAVLGSDLPGGDELSREESALVSYPLCCLTAVLSMTCTAWTAVARLYAQQGQQVAREGMLAGGPRYEHPIVNLCSQRFVHPALCPLSCLQVDYYLGLQADRFIGNSVSTFTAFIILERQWLGRCAGGLCRSKWRALVPTQSEREGAVVLALFKKGS